MAEQKDGTRAWVTWNNGEESGSKNDGGTHAGTLTIEKGSEEKADGANGFFPATTLVYDGTFGGFLTAIFVVYNEYRGVEAIDIIPPERHQPGIFQTERIIDHDAVLADRVWNGLLRHLTREQAGDIYATFLGESPAREGLMLDYVRKVFATSGEVATDYLDETARMIRVWGRRVRRDRAHVESTLRFHESSTGEYYALVEPEYNVLPLAAEHFRERYEDESWVIYDIRRGYGIHFDGTSLRKVTLDGVEGDTRHFFNLNATDRNPLFQKLWKEQRVKSRSDQNLGVGRRRDWRYGVEQRA